MLRRIGVGAYGEVWMARSVTGGLRAVKIVFREHFDHDRTYEREFAGLKNFEPISRAHPGFVDILHVGRNDTAGYFFCVMELADNAEWAPTERQYTPLTLAEHIRAEGRLSVAECARIGAEVAGALVFLHEQNLIHRDVKPSNIIFVNSQPKLADIGLLASVGEARSFVGTDGFIPPEGPGSPHGDIYGLGKTLYEMATGRSRLDFPDLPAIFENPSDGPAFLELNEIILRACAPEPSGRHSTAKDLRGELLLVDAGRSIRRMRRNEHLLRIWWRVGLAASIVLVIAACGFWWERSRAREADREAAAQARQRQIVEGKERIARENLYAADMNLAQQAIDGGNYGRATTLLNAYLPAAVVPDLRGLEWFYYWQILRGDSIDVLKGHSHVVSCLALSDTGTTFFSGSFDYTVREWSLQSRRELHQWKMPGCAFASIAVDSENHRLVGEAGNLHFSALLDLQTGAWLTNISSNSSSVAFAPDQKHILRGANSSIFATNGVIQIVDLQYKVERTLAEAGGRVLFAPNGKTFATGPWGQRVKLWSWPQLSLLGELPEAGVVLSMSFSPDGAKLATVSQLGRLSLWDVATKRLVAWRDAHGANVIWSVAFSPDGKRIATSGTDQTVRTWDSETLDETHVYRGHESEVWAVIWSKDGRELFSSGKDMTIRIWNAQPAPPPARMSGVIQRPIFSPGGKYLASKLRGDSAVVWQVHGAKELLRIQDIIEVGGFSPDEQNLIVLTSEGDIQSRAISDGRVVESHSAPKPPARFAKRLLSPSGRWLIWGLFDGEVLAADTTSTNNIHLIGHSDMILSLGISRDERHVLSGSVDRKARLWELPSGKTLREFGNHKMGVGSVAFSNDAAIMATGSWDDTVHIWDLAAQNERMILAGHEGGVQSVAFSPDNRTIVALTGTSIVKFWSLPAQREAGQIRFAPGTRQGFLGISNDGEWLTAVTQSEEMTLLPAPRDLLHPSR
jgi:WD40 repeat protein